jgi:LETM1-like protein
VSPSKTAMVATFVKGSALYIVDIVSNPRETWHHIKKEASHYWLGTKLLWSEIKMAKSIVTRLLQGFGMTRRER